MTLCASPKRQKADAPLSHRSGRGATRGALLFAFLAFLFFFTPSPSACRSALPGPPPSAPTEGCSSSSTRGLPTPSLFLPPLTFARSVRSRPSTRIMILERFRSLGNGPARAPLGPHRAHADVSEAWGPPGGWEALLHGGMDSAQKGAAGRLRVRPQTVQPFL